jgi:transposase
MNRMGRGYSFEAAWAKMLYTEGLHKIERPKYEWRAAGRALFMTTRVPEDAIGMMTVDEAFGEPTNFGTDISTLARRIDADRFCVFDKDGSGARLFSMFVIYTEQRSDAIYW